MTQKIRLSELIAKRITGPHNKDCVMLLVGERGSGKSMSALYLAEQVSIEVAKAKGGLPTDYFNMSHISIIDPVELMKQLSNIKKYGIYIMDDAGVSWNSRRSQSNQNLVLNRILTTVRTQNSFLLVTSPTAGSVDLTVRNMAAFYAEVAESHHGRGINYLKIFRQSFLNRAKKSIFSHLTFHNADGTSSKITRWITRLPSPQIVAEYEKLRTENAIKLMQEHNIEKKEVVKAPNKWEAMVQKYGEQILAMHREKKTLQEIAFNTGLSEYYVRRLKTSVGAF